MIRTTLFVLAAALLVALTLTACGDDDDDEEPTVTEPAGDSAERTATPAGDDATPVDMETPTEADATPAGAASPTSEEATPDGAGTPTGDDATPADEGGAETDDNGMTFTAFDAGEVELARDGDNLQLIEIRPNEGWDHRVDDVDDDDEIEVDFRRENHEVDFDAEIEDGRLKIEISDDQDDAEPGTFVVTEAGEVEFERDGDSLSLTEVRPNDGWDYRVDDNDDDEEIEVEFRRDRDEAEFEAEIDDGQLNVDISVEYFVEDES